jgi:hypothetical protein
MKATEAILQRAFRLSFPSYRGSLRVPLRRKARAALASVDAVCTGCWLGTIMEPAIMPTRNATATMSIIRRCRLKPSHLSVQEFLVSAIHMHLDPASLSVAIHWPSICSAARSWSDCRQSKQSERTQLIETSAQKTSGCWRVEQSAHVLNCELDSIEPPGGTDGPSSSRACCRRRR